MEQENYGLYDALAMMRRRQKQFWITLIGLLLLTLVVTFSWPAAYRSVATILITQQEIPTEIVPSTISGYAEQQIRVIEQRVMTSKNLLEIIDKFGLYEDEKDRLPRTELVELARENTAVEMISANVVDPRGRAQEATIAFTLSFDNERPRTAQQVANELVSLFLNENLRSRINVTRDTAEFLGQQAGALNRQILDLEEQVSRFKQQNEGALPSDYATNLQFLQRAEAELVETERALGALRDRRLEIESQMVSLSRDATVRLPDGGTVLSPVDQLHVLQSQYASLVALYGDNHPDVVRIKRQIEGLEKSTGVSASATDITAQLQAARSELTVARERYTDDHPEVQRLERVVAGLEAEQANAAPSSVAAAGTPASAPTNPAYIQMQLRYESTLADLHALEGKRALLQQRLAGYQAALSRAPEAERVYTALTRQLDDARAQHREIVAKQMEAELSREVEQNRKGERFELVEPPVEPTEPYSPNRLVWLFLGLLLSIAGAVGAVAVAENLDQAVRGAEAVTALFGVAPLAVIPYIYAEGEAAGVDRRKLFLVLGIAGGALLLALLLVNFLYKPLDVVWYIVMRKLGL